MEQTASRLPGITIKQQTPGRIRVGVHRDGIRSILSLFNISEETISQVIAEANGPWANINLIQRERAHEKGYTHFAVPVIREGV